ncbi:hypothetical protein A2118_02005 [Candidatus Kaiserbacteria bacterium GWA2_50_9]|uniref:PKD domain-containing protein n=1 Tax=Candidatus Kaiserbacteria bacterium GWA2_50_9 TaxID=1798474 RepID=A0A1F6BUI2_9BACT|nr:MAG: hypothetical protein A2118_02005 [Candidatus Kaiserbacteria bacterium GWA2_50_9]
MRIAGLLLLIVLFPVYAYAALLNINTADATFLDTLPGIGPSKATAIIDYRTQHGPFAQIEDIQNVSGIGPSTYGELKTLITVGGVSAPQTPSTDTATTTTSETAPANPSGGSTPYTPPPMSLTVKMSPVTEAFINVPLHISARVTTKGGAVDTAAQLSWSFGDGSSQTGTVVEKTYGYAGTYVITVDTTDGLAVAHDEAIVAVRPAQVRIVSVSSEGITLANDASERLNLSDWQLSTGGVKFRIPRGTTLLQKSSVFLPSSITHLTMPFDATLAYANGAIAARYAPPSSVVQEVEVQPSLRAVSYEQVQAVKPPPVVNKDGQIISTKENIQTHEEAVIAPTAATELAAVGAASSPAPLEPATRTSSGIFKSPWTLGFLGVLALAGSAFIFL